MTHNRLQLHIAQYGQNTNIYRSHTTSYGQNVIISDPQIDTSKSSYTELISLNMLCQKFIHWINFTEYVMPKI